MAKKGQNFYYWFLVIVDDKSLRGVKESLRDSADETAIYQSEDNLKAARDWQKFNQENEIEKSIKQEFFGMGGVCYYIQSMFRFRSKKKLTASQILDLRTNFETSINELEGMFHVAYLGMGDREEPDQGWDFYDDD